MAAQKRLVISCADCADDAITLDQHESGAIEIQVDQTGDWVCARATVGEGDLDALLEFVQGAIAQRDQQGAQAS